MKQYPILCFLLFSFLSSCAQPDNNVKTAASIVPVSTEEKRFDGGFINIPAGWKVEQSGACSDMSFLSWDPANVARQFFCYATAGIFYLSQQQKQMDASYVRMGGMRTPLIDKPVINPLTPENYIRSFHLLAELPWFGGARTLPEIYNVEIVSSTPQPSGMPGTPATAASVRAVFTNRSKTVVSEGLFLVTVLPMYMASYGPGANFGVAYSFMGITAPLNELETVMPTLNKCLQSFYLDDNYVSNCIRAANGRTEGTLKAGKTLSKSSESIMSAWETRSRSTDIISQKRSDGMMGRSRLYDSQTGTVFQVDNTFIDTYRSDPGKFNYKNLQTLPPDDVKLWKQPMLNGSENIKRVN